MKQLTCGVALLTGCGLASAVLLQAQGRGGAEWTTAHGDAQRSSWVRTDAKVSAASLRKPGDFQLLWKLKLHNEPRQLNSLTQPVLLNRLVGFRGFKAIAVVGASADTMYALDYDLGRPLWTTVLNYSAENAVPPSSWNCPGGLMAAATRPTAVAPSAFGGRGGGRAGGRSGGSVGEPGRGAPNLAIARQGRAGAAPGAPGAPGRAGGGGGGGRGGAQIFGLADAFYSMGSDGFVHALSVQNGADLFPPVKFLPENSKPSALLLAQHDFDGDGAAEAGVLYTSTSNGCGTTPNGVWALDLTSKDKMPVVWKTNGGSVVGSAGPALGTDGTIYAAVGNGTTGYSNSVVALEPRTLTLKDWVTVPGADFNASPTVFRYKDKDLVVVTGNDGRMYLLDSASLGGANHTTPLHVTPKYSAAMGSGALATWESPATARAQPAPATRWIVAPAAGSVPAAPKFAANGPVTSGAIATFKLVDDSGKLSLEPGWVSRDMTPPLPPLIVNGVVFAVSGGEFRGAGNLTAAQRAQRSTPAVLYALDGATGKELWNSGKTMTSFARSGLAAGGTNGSQVFVTTYDSTLYSFGFPIEK